MNTGAILERVDENVMLGLPQIHEADGWKYEGNTAPVEKQNPTPTRAQPITIEHLMEDFTGADSSPLPNVEAAIPSLQKTVVTETVPKQQVQRRTNTHEGDPPNAILLSQIEAIIHKADQARRTEAMEEEKEKKKPQPLRFKDAVGRKFSFPFHLCEKWGVSQLFSSSASFCNDTVFLGHG